MVDITFRRFARPGFRSRICWFAVGAFVAGFGLVICVRFIGDARTEARESLGKGRIAQIGLAIHNYHAVTGELPPICIRDRSGKPLHSWRVLILPYCGLGDVYNRYDFNEAWNGPHNSTLAAEVSERVAPIFRCPNDRSGSTNSTTFLAVTVNDVMNSEHLVMNDGAAMSPIPTIVELHGSGIHWMEPRDLSVMDARASLAHAGPESGAVYYLANDGRVWTLAEGQLVYRNSKDMIINSLFERWPVQPLGSH
jgi:Protein of unknown function (DUF1559)